MPKSKQAWLIAVGSSQEPLPEKWIEERPDLLKAWPIGKKSPSGIQRDDRLIYYAADHQKLLAVLRASGTGEGATGTLAVQAYLAIPDTRLAPHWGVLGKPPEAMEGMKAILLTDREYERALDAFLSRARLSEK